MSKKTLALAIAFAIGTLSFASAEEVTVIDNGDKAEEAVVIESFNQIEDDVAGVKEFMQSYNQKYQGVGWISISEILDGADIRTTDYNNGPVWGAVSKTIVLWENDEKWEGRTILNPEDSYIMTDEKGYLVRYNDKTGIYKNSSDGEKIETNIQIAQHNNYHMAKGEISLLREDGTQSMSMAFTGNAIINQDKNQQAYILSGIDTENNYQIFGRCNVEEDQVNSEYTAYGLKDNTMTTMKTSYNAPSQNIIYEMVELQKHLSNPENMKQIKDTKQPINTLSEKYEAKSKEITESIEAIHGECEAAVRNN